MIRLPVELAAKRQPKTDDEKLKDAERNAREKDKEQKIKKDKKPKTKNKTTKQKLVDVGKDAFKKSGALDTLVGVGLTSLIGGPLAGELKHGVVDKLSNMGLSKDSDDDEVLTPKEKEHEWFYKKSKKEQDEYLKEHPESIFQTLPKGRIHKTQKNLKTEQLPESKDHGLKSLDEINRESEIEKEEQEDLVEKEKERMEERKSDQEDVQEEIKKLAPETKVEKLSQAIPDTKVKTDKKPKSNKLKKKQYRMQPSKNTKKSKRKSHRTWASLYFECASTKESKAALSALYLITVYTDTDGNKPPAAIKKKAIGLTTDATSFFTDHKIPKLALQRLLNKIANGDTYNEATDSQWKIKLADSIRGKYSQLEKNLSLSKEEVGLFKSFVSYFKRGSDSAIKNIDRRVSMLGDAELNLLFNKSKIHNVEADKNSQVSTEKKIEALLKKHFGKALTVLSVEDAKKFSAKKPEEYKQYLALRRQLNQVYKEYIKQYVRASGKETVDYKSVIQALNAEKIKHNLPLGFEGLIDDQLNYYTKLGKMIKGKPGGNVEMNPNYDPRKDNAYVFTAQTPMGQAYFYTEAYKDDAKTSKSENVTNLEKNIKTIQKKWLEVLRKGNEKDKLKAAQLEIMFQFGARSGTGGGATGITTLTNKEVKQNGANIVIKYIGKKGAAQQHTIAPVTPANKLLIKLIQEKMKEGKPNDPLWTYFSKSKNTTVPLPASSTLSFLKKIANDPNAKLHYVRHLMGTKIARQVIKDAPFKKGEITQSKAEAWYKEAMKAVGEALVHSTNGKVTGTTAIQSYIEPTLQRKFFTDLGLRVPNWIP